MRGAGFPARQVLDLAADEAPAEADAVAELEARAKQLRKACATKLRPMLRTHDRKLVDKALRALHRGAVPDAWQVLADDVAELRELVELDAELARQRERMEAAFARDYERILDRLHAIAGDSRFREAVLWQNREAYKHGLEWLSEHRGAANKSARKKQHMLASYLQRYCAKNDFVGFFGPVAFASVSDRRDAISATPGASFLDKRTVYFEHWCIDTIAQVLAQDPELKPYLLPRRMPTVRLDGCTVHYPVNRVSELPLAFARLLAACDGKTPAREIAARLAQDRELGLDSEADVFEMLDELTRKRFCTWALEIRTVTEWPERALSELLEPVPPSTKQPALAALAAIDAKREAIARAAGNPEQLEGALAQLDATFEELTAQAPTRKRGEMYAGRTLVYEDCRRDLRVEVGRDFLDRLGRPLAPVLQSARWLTYRVAELYRPALAKALDDAGGGAAAVDYLVFWQHAKHLFPEGGERSPLILQAIGELQHNWAQLVPFAPGARRVRVSVDDIEAKAKVLFAAPHPGWPGARYHAPDVMIAARDVDAIRAGEYLIVLGELHPSVCTMHFLAQKEHPERADMIRARELDLPHVIPYPVVSKEHASRADHMWVSRHDVDIEFGTTRSWRPRENVIAVSSLVVERVGDDVRVRDRDSGRSFDVVAFFGPYLNAAIGTGTELFPIAEHTPRVEIDDLVIAREQWRPPLEGLTFASITHGPAQFAAARSWVREHEVPRWAFVKIPEEPKPMYVDFESPIYVEMFAKAIRKASRVTLSEMLPTPEQCWLPDGAGNTYCCEFRFVVVDSASYPG